MIERSGDRCPRRLGAALARVASSPRARLGILAAVLAAGAVAAVALAPSRTGLEDAVRSTGVAGPLVYAVLYAALTVALVPGSLLTAVGGLLFGVALGTALTVASATIGAAASFWLARRLGREQVRRIAGPRTGALDAWIARNGFVAVLYVRLVPVVPFNVLNYVAGVTAVGFRAYISATAIGIIPGTFAYTALGGSFEDPASPEFIAAVALIVVLAAGAPFAQRAARRRGLIADAPPAEADAPGPAAGEPRR